MSCENIKPIKKTKCNDMPINNQNLQIDLQKMEIKLGKNTLGKITGFIVNNGIYEQRIDINLEAFNSEQCK
jgi:hypothetical protein